MRWLVVLFALSLAPACTTDKEDAEKETTEEKAKKPADKAKKPSDKAGASSKKGGDKASASSKKGGAEGKSKAGEKKPQPTYGAKGEVVGDLTLSEVEEGEKTKTSAKISLVSGEKEETVKLGAIPGTCEKVEPAKLEQGTALWTVDCKNGAMEASISIAQQGSALIVAKAAQGGEYKPLRKIKLVEGAEVVAKGAAE